MVEQESQSQVYFMAYELIKQEAEKSQLLYENELFWKYRPSITFELMSIELKKYPNECKAHKILKKFSELFVPLQLLVNLPPMIKLVKMLMENFNKSIFKLNAQDKSIGELIDGIQLSNKGFCRLFFFEFFS
jgi:hypothetical protein